MAYSIQKTFLRPSTILLFRASPSSRLASRTVLPGMPLSSAALSMSSLSTCFPPASRVQIRSLACWVLAKTQQAKDLICTLLAGGKQVLSEDIDKAALERGIPGRTVRDAKRELGDALKSKIVEGRKKVFWME